MLHHCYRGLASIHDGAITNKATITIQQISLHELAILKWNGFGPVNKDWPNLKSNFGEAYDVRLRSGADTVDANGYHGVANATDGVDDDIIGSIRESFGAIQVANNANNADNTNFKSRKITCQP